MEGSMLNDIKKLFGITEDNEDFDLDLKLHINSCLSTLNQLGIGTEQPFVIESKYETWEEFLGEDLQSFQDVKMYIYYKTKLGFDPTTSATIVSQLNEEIRELEWRMRIKSDMKREKEGENINE